MNVREIRSSLSAGELDPRLSGRGDLRDYAQGAQKLRNWALMVTGGARRRWGFEYAADAGADGRIEEFVFSEGQEYVLHFKNTALAIYDSTGTACTVTGSVSWTLAQVWGIDYTYFGDTIIITHKDVGMWKVLRTGSAAFTVTALAFETAEVSAVTVTRQPYYKYAPDSVTLAASGTTGSVTLTASASVFTSAHVGTKIRYKKKQMTVTAYTSGTELTATVDETLPASAADLDWDEATFSTAHGYPLALCFHENRLWMGGSRDAPTLLAASKLGAYFNYDVGTGLDSESIQVRVTFDRMGAIRYLTSGRHLLIHADGQEVYAPNPADKILTPGNIAFRRQTPYGSAQVKVRLMEDSALFVQRTKTAVRETLYDFLQSSYTSNGISYRSSHLLTGPRQMCVLHGTSAGPEQYAFIVQDDGTMAVLSSIRNEKLAGWTPWEVEDADIVSACSTISTLWLLVKRTVSGSPVYYLEKANPDICLDAATKTTISASTDMFMDLAHLNGKTVHAVCGTTYYGSAVVSAGNVTLPDTIPVEDGDSKDVWIGEMFESQIETLPPVVNAPDGPTFMINRRVSEIAFKVRSVLSFYVEGDRFFPHLVTDDMTSDPVPVSTVLTFSRLGYSESPSVSASVGVPLQVELLAVTMTVNF